MNRAINRKSITRSDEQLNDYLATDIVALCRSGFESETGQELLHFAQQRGIFGFVKANHGDAYIVYRCYDAESAQRLLLSLDVNQLVFARDLMLAKPLNDSLDPTDRVNGILESFEGAPVVSRIIPWVADSNDGKSLSRLSRKIVAPLKQGLEKLNRYDKHAGWCLNLMFVEGTSVIVGISRVEHQPVWPCGIAHLKMPAEAPSRSTLKLDEAILFFLTPEEQSECFGLGKTAVDLGACPGGWTYQLVKRDLQVFAIDNGEMAPSLMATGQVEHVKADGFRYRPPHPVNWLVCDMVEKPARIAALMADWIVSGDSERAMFNLKLPMKKRFAMVQECVEIIRETMDGRPFELYIKQLYHDREEVTAYLKAG